MSSSFVGTEIPLKFPDVVKFVYSEPSDLLFGLPVLGRIDERGTVCHKCRPYWSYITIQSFINNQQIYMTSFEDLSHSILYYSLGWIKRVPDLKTDTGFWVGLVVCQESVTFRCGWPDVDDWFT